MKNKLFVNFINKKDPILNEEFHTNYKKDRNLPSTLIKRSKQAYLKDILKQIKSLKITIKSPLVWRTWTNTKIKRHTFYLVIFLTIFSKFVVI